MDAHATVETGVEAESSPAPAAGEKSTDLRKSDGVNAKAEAEVSTLTLRNVFIARNDGNGTPGKPPARFIFGSTQVDDQNENANANKNENADSGQGEQEAMIISSDTHLNPFFFEGPSLRLCSIARLPEDKKLDPRDVSTQEILGDANANAYSANGVNVKLVDISSLLYVYCNNIYGYLCKEAFDCGNRGSCILGLLYSTGEQRWFTPSEFEAGCGYSPRSPWSWKYSISYNGFPLEALLNNHVLNNNSPELRIREDWPAFIEMQLKRSNPSGVTPLKPNASDEPKNKKQKSPKYQAPPMSLPFSSCTPLDPTSAPLESLENWTKRVGDDIVKDFKKMCITSKNSGFEQMPNASLLVPLPSKHHLHKIVGLIDKLATFSISNRCPHAWITLDRIINEAVTLALDVRDFFAKSYLDIRYRRLDASLVPGWDEEDTIVQQNLDFHAEKIQTDKDDVQYELCLRPITPFDPNFKQITMKMDTKEGKVSLLSLNLDGKIVEEVVPKAQSGTPREKVVEQKSCEDEAVSISIVTPVPQKIIVSKEENLWLVARDVGDANRDKGSPLCCGEQKKFSIRWLQTENQKPEGSRPLTLVDFNVASGESVWRLDGIDYALKKAKPGTWSAMKVKKSQNDNAGSKNPPEFSDESIEDASLPLFTAIRDGVDLICKIKKLLNSANIPKAWNTGFGVVNATVTSVIGLRGYFQEMRKKYDH